MQQLRVADRHMLLPFSYCFDYSVSLRLLQAAGMTAGVK